MKLAETLRKFESTLTPAEVTQLSEQERSAMRAETRELFARARAKGGGQMSKSAQAAVPPNGQMPPIPPAGKAGQMPLPPEGAAGTDPTACGSACAEAPVPVPPVAPSPQQPVQAEGIDDYINEVDQQNAGALSSNEMGIKEPENKVASKVQAYRDAYAHIRIRPTAKQTLEVFDSKTAQVLMTLRPNTSTRNDQAKLRRMAVSVLRSIGSEGLAKTAELWKAQVHTASGGIVDYGTMAMHPAPKNNDNSINDRGETTMQQDVTLGVDSTTGEGNNLTTTEQPETREPAGLSKSSQAKGDGILPGHDTNLADPPPEAPQGNALSVLDNAEDNLEDKRTPKDKGSDSSLDDAITTFANETLTASLRRSQTEPQMNGSVPAKSAQQPPAQPPMPEMPVTGQEQQPQPMPPVQPIEAAPGMGGDVLPADPSTVDPSTMSDEQKIAHFHRKRAEKEIAQNTRDFIARFVRSIRIAARRQALNLEPNQLKIAVADALMTEAPISRREVYQPMDARTATFVIERGLDQANALAYVDGLVRRAGAFMKMSDEAIAQIEEDLNVIQPVEPSTEKEGQENPASPGVMPQMPQMAQTETETDDMSMVPGADDYAADPMMQDPSQMLPQEADEDPGVAGQPGGMELPMQQTPEQRAASIRQRAASGNLPINTGAAVATATAQPFDKRAQIRFAVGGTKSAGLRSFFGNR